MHVINVRNVNDALCSGITYLLREGIREDSRNGPVIVAPGPVTTVYARPCERVLFSPTRDANPFFHLIGDALWCLSGSNEIEWPTYFNKRYTEYSDDGRTQHGAYGARWRRHFAIEGEIGPCFTDGHGVTFNAWGRAPINQLQSIIDELREKPGSRQAVLTMWDVGADLRHVGKDVPCNTHVYFDRRGGVLNMTVCNRSNDIIWGCYGANAVQFSVLQEYIATAVGVPVGIYRQVSNNFHVYTEKFDQAKLELIALESYEASSRYDELPEGPAALIETSAEAWDADLRLFMQIELDDPHAVSLYIMGKIACDDFFNDVVRPMLAAYRLYKKKEYATAIALCDEEVAAPDWRWACVEWLQRRKANWESKK